MDCPIDIWVIIFFVYQYGWYKEFISLFWDTLFQKTPKTANFMMEYCQNRRLRSKSSHQSQQLIFSWFSWATELLVLVFLMKILPVFGGFWDKLIKNDQKIIITDVLVNEKCHASNRTVYKYGYFYINFGFIGYIYYFCT